MPRTFTLRIIVASIALLAILSAVFTLRKETSVGAASSFKGVLTWHNDNQRTGDNTSETTLTLQNVKSATFGKLFVIPTDGLVDAQPLYAANITVSGASHNLLLIATEHGSVYGVDADSGRVLWQITTVGHSETHQMIAVAVR